MKLIQTSLTGKKRGYYYNIATRKYIDIDLLENRYLNNSRTVDILTEFNMSYHLLSKLLEKYDIPKRQPIIRHLYDENMRIYYPYGNPNIPIDVNEIEKLYDEGVPLKVICKNYGISAGTFKNIFNEFDFVKRPQMFDNLAKCVRWNFKIKEIDPPNHIKKYIGNKKLYKLGAAYCDYIAIDETGESILIEEKTTLNSRTWPYAAYQLIIGEIIVKENLENIHITRKLILGHKDKLYVYKSSASSKLARSKRREYVLEDLKQYLNIDVLFC